MKRRDRTFADTSESGALRSKQARCAAISASKGAITREKILTLLRTGDQLLGKLMEETGLTKPGILHHLHAITCHRVTWKKIGSEWEPVYRLGKGKSMPKPRHYETEKSTLILEPGQQLHDFWLRTKNRNQILKKAANELARGQIAKLEFRIAA